MAEKHKTPRKTERETESERHVGCMQTERRLQRERERRDGGNAESLKHQTSTYMHVSAVGQ